MTAIRHQELRRIHDDAAHASALERGAQDLRRESLAVREDDIGECCRRRILAQRVELLVELVARGRDPRQERIARFRRRTLIKYTPRNCEMTCTNLVDDCHCFVTFAGGGVADGGK